MNAPRRSWRDDVMSVVLLGKSQYGAQRVEMKAPSPRLPTVADCHASFDAIVTLALPRATSRTLSRLWSFRLAYVIVIAKISLDPANVPLMIQYLSFARLHRETTCSKSRATREEGAEGHAGQRHARG